MTWSIVARDARTGAFGVAVATRYFAVGAICPWAKSGVGAIATQALINPLYGPRGLELLRDGAGADATVQRLLAADPGAATRQIHVVDAAGRSAAHTGVDTKGWSGHRIGDGFSVAGNMLAGERVLAATFDAFAASDAPLAERLIDALDAGEAEGGDRRGKQSAALTVFTTEDYPQLSLRVDDHPEPLAELRRLYRVSQGRFAVFRPFMPTRANPAGTWSRPVIEAEAMRIAALRHEALHSDAIDLDEVDSPEDV
jgi:uncharacterized Ntn-hydrolase superfamily protein